MIVPAEELAMIREQSAGRTLALVHGAFDIIHPGHVGHIEAAKKLADIAIVAVCSDENVRSRKGSSRPVNGVADRMAVINALRAVDYVFELTGTGWPDELLRPHIAVLRPDKYLLSSPKQRPYGDQSYTKHADGSVTTLIYDELYARRQHSTTGIIAQAISKSGEAALDLEKL